MGKEKFHRVKIDITNIKTNNSELSIDIPSLFTIDTNALYKAVMKELCKQEKAAKQ